MEEYQNANAELMKRRKARLGELYKSDWAEWEAELNARGLCLNGDMM